MSSFTCDHGQAYELFGSGGGDTLAREIDAPLLARIPLEPAVAAGSDAGEPAALGEGPAADAFRALAERLVTDVLPPLEMEGCTARVLQHVEDALGPT